mmetsp:Transcript_61736/g.169843  ORF Transcript_61736/g.169843 Transcript_61736/m.169843 type:complete len:373 (-) Transcript_61736:1371-2489(-)
MAGWVRTLAARAIAMATTTTTATITTSGFGVSEPTYGVAQFMYLLVRAVSVEIDPTDQNDSMNATELVLTELGRQTPGGGDTGGDAGGEAVAMVHAAALRALHTRVDLGSGGDDSGADGEGSVVAAFAIRCMELGLRLCESGASNGGSSGGLALMSEVIRLGARIPGILGKICAHREGEEGEAAKSKKGAAKKGKKGAKEGKVGKGGEGGEWVMPRLMAVLENYTQTPQSAHDTEPNRGIMATRVASLVHAVVASPLLEAANSTSRIGADTDADADADGNAERLCRITLRLMANIDQRQEHEQEQEHRGVVESACRHMVGTGWGHAALRMRHNNFQFFFTNQPHLPSLPCITIHNDPLCRCATGFMQLNELA